MHGLEAAADELLKEARRLAGDLDSIDKSCGKDGGWTPASSSATLGPHPDKQVQPSEVEGLLFEAAELVADNDHYRQERNRRAPSPATENELSKHEGNGELLQDIVAERSALFQSFNECADTNLSMNTSQILSDDTFRLSRFNVHEEIEELLSSKYAKSEGVRVSRCDADTALNAMLYTKHNQSTQKSSTQSLHIRHVAQKRMQEREMRKRAHCPEFGRADSKRVDTRLPMHAAGIKEESVYRVTGRYNVEDNSLRKEYREHMLRVPEEERFDSSAVVPSVTRAREAGGPSRSRSEKAQGGLNSTECRFDAYSLHAPAQAASAAMVLTRHHKSIAGQQICGQRQGAERLGRKSYVDDILKRGTAVQDKARASTWAGVNEFFARTANESSALVSSVDPSRRRVDFNHYT